MNTHLTEPNEPGQKAIDAGSAALLSLPSDCQALAVATAHQWAKDRGLSDWRAALVDACRIVNRIRLRENFRDLRREVVR